MRYVQKRKITMPKKFRKTLEIAHNQMAIGRIYLEDGALLSAARCFRDAADLYEQAHHIRLSALKKTMEAGL